ELLGGEPVRISIESAMERVRRRGVRVVFRDGEEALVRATTAMRRSGALRLNFTKHGESRTQSTFDRLRMYQGVREVWVAQHVLDLAARESHLGAQSEGVDDSGISTSSSTPTCGWQISSWALMAPRHFGAKMTSPGWTLWSRR
ncbi:hypothetical protein, partial [Nocardia lijiangensis]|uniref:hypothetical protein n=1 Tax=Nocardia lijiangensis TaxID=299618 RepID=UPI001C3F5AC9